MELRREFEFQLDVIIVIIISSRSLAFSGRDLAVQLEMFFSPITKQILKQSKESCTTVMKSHQPGSSCPLDLTCPVSTNIGNKSGKNQKMKRCTQYKVGDIIPPQQLIQACSTIRPSFVSVKLCCLNFPHFKMQWRSKQAVLHEPRSTSVTAISLPV